MPGVDARCRVRLREDHAPVVVLGQPLARALSADEVRGVAGMQQHARELIAELHAGGVEMLVLLRPQLIRTPQPAHQQAQLLL